MGHRTIKAILAGGMIFASSTIIFAHGDVVPQAVDTAG